MSCSMASRASSSCGGWAPPWRATWRCRRAMRVRTSLLVTGSELTTATMKSACRGPDCAGASGAGSRTAPIPDVPGRRTPCAPAPCDTKEARQTRPMAKARGFMVGRCALVVVAETAGGADLIAQVAVAGDILLEAAERVRSQAQAREADEFDLEQQTRIGRGQAVLQAFKHHTADPATAVVLDAHHGVHQLAVLQAVIEAPHAVPAPPLPARLCATGTSPEAVQRPLPAHIHLLAGPALQAVGRADDPVIPGLVARTDGRADGAAGLLIELHCGVHAPLRRPVHACAEHHVGQALAHGRRSGQCDVLVGKTQALRDAEARRLGPPGPVEQSRR